MQQSTNIVCDGLALLKLEKKIFITIDMTTIARRFDDGVRKNNATLTKRWAPLSPPDKFDVADAKWTPACVLASRVARGGALGGTNGGIKMCRLIVQLGSRVFF